MECLVISALVFIVLAVAIGLAVGAQNRADRVYRVYAAVAQRYSGWAWSGGWFGRTGLTFRYARSQVQVWHGRKGPTSVLMQWPLEGPDLTIIARGGGGSPFAAAGERFADRFHLSSPDPQAASLVLIEGVCLQLERLRRLPPVGQLRVEFTRGRLAIFKERPRSGPGWFVEDLDALLQLSLGLFDQAMLTRSAGIEFLATVSAPPQDAICQVCGEELGAEIVYCQRCKTPHHRDCWEYYGACSVYGCRETHFHALRLAGR